MHHITLRLHRHILLIYSSFSLFSFDIYQYLLSSLCSPGNKHTSLRLLDIVLISELSPSLGNIPATHMIGLLPFKCSSVLLRIYSFRKLHDYNSKVRSIACRIILRTDRAVILYMSRLGHGGILCSKTIVSSFEFPNKEKYKTILLLTS